MSAGLPLDGVRVLALEQMQALPYATQLLARLGADVVKVEPIRGESGRASLPAMRDPQGRAVGATFLRNNLNKRSICVDVKSPEGRQLVLDLASQVDVVAENSKPGTMTRLGLGYEDVAAAHPGVIYVSVSGFGNTVETPYADWPAYAAIVEAMSGIYEFKREGDGPPRVIPVGALGDISAALFAAIGVFAALRHKERTGRGQYVDVAMLDAVVAMTDIVTNFWSMGVRDGGTGGVIVDGFRADDGWFVLQVGRQEHFEKMARLIGRPDLLSDPRLADRAGWVAHADDVIRPAVEAWARGRTKFEASDALGAAGLAAGPCLAPGEVLEDEHLHARGMLVALERTDDVAEPVVVPGNPVKLTDVPEQPDRRPPWLGEHTDEVLIDLGLDPAAVADLKRRGIVA